MAQQIMWSPRESVYRGQATDGTVITIEEPAMSKALKEAGNSIYEADWWRETLTVTLQRWGIMGKSWMDDVTATPRVHYSLGEPTRPEPDEVQQHMSGPLSTRLLSRKKEQ